MAEVPKNRKVQKKIRIFLPELFRPSDPEKLWPIFSSKNRRFFFSQDIVQLQDKLHLWQKLQEDGEKLTLLSELALAEADWSQCPDTESKFCALKEDLELCEVKRTLSGAMDGSQAIADIRSEAGAPRARTLAEMLLLMYFASPSALASRFR
jgi:hypothetical protein